MPAYCTLKCMYVSKQHCRTTACSCPIGERNSPRLVQAAQPWGFPTEATMTGQKEDGGEGKEIGASMLQIGEDHRKPRNTNISLTSRKTNARKRSENTAS
jgi:hypothetical protein